jgi:hypothetical protein
MSVKYLALRHDQSQQTVKGKNPGDRYITVTETNSQIGRLPVEAAAPGESFHKDPLQLAEWSSRRSLDSIQSSASRICGVNRMSDRDRHE